MADEHMKILVAEDDLEMLGLLEQILTEEGHEIHGVSNGREALDALKRGDFDLVLSDIRMPHLSGMEMLEKARASYLHQPVILMTAFGSIESAVEAMKAGAYSYIPKPFDLDELLAQIGEVAHQVRLKKEAAARLKDDETANAMGSIVFKSKAFQHVMDLVSDVAQSSATVLITGESGTGKERIAEQIHKQSNRADKPFIAFNVTAIAETLLESELFGHVKGAFTNAVNDKTGLIRQAEGGTLFLDEIGDMALSMQIKLLRFIQERYVRPVGSTEMIPVGVRLVAATNHDLQELIRQGRFREDLYYRLSVVNIELPPLRERPEDIMELAYHFLRLHNQDEAIEGFSPDARALLRDYPWPGNVRQLQNAIEYACLRRKSGSINKPDLPKWLHDFEPTKGYDLRSLDKVEQAHIEQVLSECEGNQSRAARILGINRRTLARKLKQYEEEE